jgi:hypothetical protein
MTKDENGPPLTISTVTVKHHRGPGSPQGRRPVVLAADHGANRKPVIEEQAGRGSPDRSGLTGGPRFEIDPMSAMQLPSGWPNALLDVAGTRTGGSMRRPKQAPLRCTHDFVAVMINASIGMTTAPPSVRNCWSFSCASCMSP